MREGFGIQAGGMVCTVCGGNGTREVEQNTVVMARTCYNKFVYGVCKYITAGQSSCRHARLYDCVASLSHEKTVERTEGPRADGSPEKYFLRNIPSRLYGTASIWS